MDARTVATFAGVDVGTLNVWVQRGLVPGMVCGARGRKRKFTHAMAEHVMLMTDLGKIGIPAPIASEIVQQGGRQVGAVRVVIDVWVN